ncbi:hypothetical protein OPT61_g7076 [Boeremia exigua]|uniref:Uncharacterized protein n=1 Tax=Boeremia exigua TaxID=749465 RepID=A0ACC2I484_9PLEO|nr:hypothetical protein OPT61_g7076 [Boeremia exigua]
MHLLRGWNTGARHGAIAFGLASRSTTDARSVEPSVASSRAVEAEDEQDWLHSKCYADLPRLGALAAPTPLRNLAALAADGNLLVWGITGGAWLATSSVPICHTLED